MERLNLKDSGRRQIFEKNATFDFRLDDTTVHFVAQVRVRREHAGFQTD
jgi:hypothetical protein